MTRLPPLRTQRCTHVFTLSTLAVLALIHIAGVRSTVDWGIARLVAIVAIIAILMCLSSGQQQHGAGAGARGRYRCDGEAGGQWAG